MLWNATSGGELFFDNWLYMYNHMMTAVKESPFFASESRHSASSPVTYQPQCIWLLSDVNVFGWLILCSLINTTNAGNKM